MTSRQRNTTAFELPEEDETEWGIDSHHNKSYPYNIEDMRTKSPTLPLHFDKKYLPHNLCEKETLKASQCLLRYYLSENQKQDLCVLELSHFEICRRVRDVRIFDGIKRWEMQHLTSLDRQNRTMYLMGMGRKLTRLEEDYSRQPSTIKGTQRAKEIEAEVKEMRWRIDYLNKHVQSLT